MNKVCGLDVHKDSVFACILDEKEEKILEERFGTLTPELDRLRETLVKHGVGQVAMESTSIYWIPVWHVLESDFELKLANPYFIKQLPGRKSDVKDAHWIATALQKGMIKGSYVPDSEIQEMRQLSRRYRRLTKQIVRVEQWLDNQLQRCNVRFSNYVSNQGNNKSLRKVIQSLIDGERDPVKLCGKVHGRTTNKHGKQVITDSLTGVLSKVDIEMLKQCMEELEFLEKQQARCIKLLEELANKHFAKEISLLCTIPGIQTLSAICILAELGGDLKAFLTAASLIGWAGLRPRNDESAGKIISRKTMHGNRYLRQILVQTAWAATRTHKCFLGKKFSLLSKRMKSQKALMAITRKLLVIIFNVLSKKEPFDPKRNRSAKKQAA
jgi:transposase